MESMWPSLIGLTLLVSVHLLMPRFHFMDKRDKPWLPARRQYAFFCVGAAFFAALMLVLEAVA